MRQGQLEALFQRTEIALEKRGRHPFYLRKRQKRFQHRIDLSLAALRLFIEPVLRIFSVPVFSIERWLLFACPRWLTTRRLKASRLVTKSTRMDETVAVSVARQHRLRRKLIENQG